MKLYRFRRFHYDEWLLTFELIVDEYEVIRETECFYIIKWHKWPKYEKRVGKKTLRRFAHPTKEEALHAFKKRNERWIRIMKANIKIAEASLGAANLYEIKP